MLFSFLVLLAQALAYGQGFPTAQVLNEGTLDCFSSGMTDGKPIPKKLTCELSSVLYADGRLLLFNDKPMSGMDPVLGQELSPVFAAPLDLLGNRVGDQREYFLEKPFLTRQKFESSALSADGRFVFAMTAFDRVATGVKDQYLNDYNALLYFPVEDHAQVKVIGINGEDKDGNSLSVRRSLARALRVPGSKSDPSYFKVEGLAAIPSSARLDESGYDKLVFGIREIGQDFKNFRYTLTLVSASYTTQGKVIQIRDDFKQIYSAEAVAEPNTDPRFLTNQEILSRGLNPRAEALGLSSIEYDARAKKLILMTSQENGEEAKNLNAFLWVITLREIHAHRRATLVRDQQGAVLELFNKGEGMTLLPGGRLFIVYDSDRALGVHPRYNRGMVHQRELNQSIYSVLRLKY